jgi:hypothetical protein
MRERSTGQRWALTVFALVGVLASGCEKAVCESVEGSCLALRVDGTGSYDRLEGVLLVSPTGAVLKAGDAATEVTLPVAVQILPPEGLSTAMAGALRVNGYRGTVLAASGLVTLSWPAGARIEVKLALNELPPADMAVTPAADLAK